MPEAKLTKNPKRGGALLELVFMNELNKLVHKFYPDDTQEAAADLQRAFNWALDRFSPQPPTVAQSLKQFMEEGIKIINGPKYPGPSFIPGAPPTFGSPPNPGKH